MKSCFWPWSHQWEKWKDKQWNRLVRDPVFVTTSSTAPVSEVGIECIQERRCTVCNKLQLRSEQTRL
jgi:hypothetical protein